MTRADDIRFDSWKEIADYLHRDLRTVRRWEIERNLPVRRLPGGGRRAVHAYKSEIDAWLNDPGNQPEKNPSLTATTALAQDADSPGLSGERFPTSKHGRSLTKLGVAAAAILILVLLSVRVFLQGRDSQAADSVSGEPVVPEGIEHWIKISFVNGQPDGLEGPFQQVLVVDSSHYATYEANNLQNIDFFDAQGKTLPSWLESGNSNTSSHTVYWIKLSNGLPPSKVVDVYLGFASKTRNMFNVVTTGEAPGLSTRYGEYDNGENVFAHYANFANSSLPFGWYSGTTSGGKGQLRLGNGVFMSHSGIGGGSVFLGSDWPVGANFAEMDLLSQVVIRGQEMIFVCSASPAQFRWTPNSVGYQDMSGLEIERNNSGTPSVLAVALPNPTQSSVIGFHDGMLFANYQQVASVHPRICDGYLASSVNSGTSASFSFDWVRVRVPPPNGVMPAVIFGELR